MSIPGYQETMGPVLRATGDGAQHTMKDIVAVLAQQFALTPEDLSVRLASGGQTLFANRVHWAATYLKKAGLLEATGRAQVRITSEGRAVLANPPARIDRSFLLRYPSFVAFAQAKAPQEDVGPTAPLAVEAEAATPRERIVAAEKELRRDLADELLAKVKTGSPRFFEGLVVDLLRAMDYGEWAELRGGPGDGGIDGVIHQDRLGLDRVYVQAKRWDSSVSRPEVQKFAGSLAGEKAHKGVLMTTAVFTREAREYARSIDTRIVLIDGTELVALMIEHDIGVSPEPPVTIKRLDNDYFDEE